MLIKQEKFIKDIESKNVQPVTQMLKEGLDPNFIVYRKNFELTPLDIAESHIIVTQLLEYGANPNIEIEGTIDGKPYKSSIIERAYEKGHYPKIQALVEFQPCSISTNSINRILALFIKSSNYPNETMITLIKASPNLMAGDNPFALAVGLKRTNIIELMLQFNFPLLEALKNNYPKINDNALPQDYKARIETFNYVGNALWFHFYTRSFMPSDVTKLILNIIIVNEATFKPIVGYLKEKQSKICLKNQFEKSYTLLNEAKNSIIKDSFWATNKSLAPGHFNSELQFHISKKPDELPATAFNIVKQFGKNFSSENEELVGIFAEEYKKHDKQAYSSVPGYSIFDSPEKRAKKIEDRIVAVLNSKQSAAEKNNTNEESSKALSM